MYFRGNLIRMALTLALAACSLVMGTAATMAQELPGDHALVAHWSFDEGHGARVRDVTGNGHDGMLKHRHAQWVPSPRGQALRFRALKPGAASALVVDGVNLPALAGTVSARFRWPDGVRGVPDRLVWLITLVPSAGDPYAGASEVRGTALSVVLKNSRPLISTVPPD